MCCPFLFCFFYAGYENASYLRILPQVPDFTFIDAPVGKDPDQRNYIVSNAKLEATGFKTSMSLDAGISELIKGYTMIKNTLYGNV